MFTTTAINVMALVTLTDLPYFYLSLIIRTILGCKANNWFEYKYHRYTIKKVADGYRVTRTGSCNEETYTESVIITVKQSQRTALKKLLKEADKSYQAYLPIEMANARARERYYMKHADYNYETPASVTLKLEEIKSGSNPFLHTF